MTTPLSIEKKDEARFFEYPGARTPDRQRTVNSGGISLTVYEWGAMSAPPLLLVHGAFDFARTFDIFAPLLADVGYRVVSYDHRGHGNSEHTDLYSWVADERDMMAVLDSTTREPCLVVGHSKGGSMLVHAIQALPHRFTRFVAIDGLPFRSPHPDSALHERKSMTPKSITEWLEQRRNAANASRRPGTLEDLARRRALLNPRLSHEWLCYLVTKGARHDQDGWRWKIDPSLKMGGFGPVSSRWMTDRVPGFPIPMLAIFGTEREPMGWDVTPADLIPYLPSSARIEVMQDTGHFIHIERPQETAALVIDFIKT